MTAVQAEVRFADFHIHVGRAQGRPVKMAAAPSLTLAAIVDHARREKGLDMVTVIDAVCPPVLAELEAMAARGELEVLPGGGLRHAGGLVVIPGAELEVAGPAGGAAHFGAWFGSLEAVRDFADWLATVQTNPALSSQRVRADAFRLQQEVADRGGLFIVHHAFTPHKGMYGSCVRRMHEMLDPQRVDAVELGLSADTAMADCLSELADLTFLSNSDAHSLPKIAREYNALQLVSADLACVRDALSLPRRIAQSECGEAAGLNRVVANFGLHPALGKYHRACCPACGNIWPAQAPVCSCGAQRPVGGVLDRLWEIRDRVAPEHPPHRPPYVHQVPLEFVPGLGPRLRARLVAAFGSEMAVLHRADVSELAEVVGAELARRIDQARRGDVDFTSGAGGVYGKVALRQK
ncbi:MAG: TIGR00375 family protein [Alicyclobacillaceae bacterium]|nr:TIGR00375 family protein [Alicyclobacillaceae bacterium]